MSSSNKKKILGSGAAIAGLAAIGVFAKGLMKWNDDGNKTKKNEKKLPRLSPALAPNFTGVKLDLSDYYLKLLSDLPEPKLLYKHFMMCLSTPRPSEKLEKMHAALKETAKLLNIEYTEDKIGNVCLKKPGSPGYENATGVVIQCHMDMVTTKTDDCKFDFENDPIQGYIDGDWLKARNTTLGADDGIGVAAGLALMEHPNLKHGPIELLITVDEETSMVGAIHLDKAPFLQNKVLINVDSEESNRICIGCAGGFNKKINVNMKRSLIGKSKEFKAYKINISGLNGGHTGIQIHLGRANAIILLCRILNYLIAEKKINVQLVEMQGGNAGNAIPSTSHCTLVIEGASSELFEECVQEYWLNYILPEYKDIESKMHMDSQPIVDFEFEKNKVCDAKTSNVLVSVMMNLPHGVLRWSPSVDGLVQTSIAFSEFELNKDSDKAVCGLFARSMAMNEMHELNRRIDSLKTLFGKDVGIEISESANLFPGWDPVTSSPALSKCKDAHIALFGEEPDVYAVHAGLECGLIRKGFHFDPSSNALLFARIYIDQIRRIEHKINNEQRQQQQQQQRGSLEDNRSTQ